MTAWDALAARRAGVPVFAPGHVWLAGAGPGDPGLLTLDALAGLTQADVVVHDALVDERVLALAGPQARLEFAGKRGGKPSATQADISERLVALARAGQRVLRLKGGDPYVFGRGGEEARTLAAAGVPFRVIPGVTAGLGALAAAAIPATLRGVNRAVIFAAGHGADEDFDWAPLARTGQPIVLYMVMHNLERIAAALLAAGLAAQTPAAIIASATTPKQRVLVSTLEKLAADAREQKFEPPAIVVIGDIVDMRAQLHRRNRDRQEGYAVTARGLIIAAPHSGAGKTTVTLAILAALKRRGIAVRAAKAGPDYIDPAFHAAATGAPSVNLDCWAMPPALLDALAAQASGGAEIFVIEGVMGLFDGSNAPAGDAAQPPISRRISNCRSCWCSMCRGKRNRRRRWCAVLRPHDPAVRIAGVILNRVASDQHRALVADAIAALGIPVLGAVPRDAALALPERHLGLVQAGEHADLASLIDRLARWPSVISISTASSRVPRPWR